MKRGLGFFLGLGVLAASVVPAAGAYAVEVGTAEELTACLDWTSEETVCTLTGDINLSSTVQVSKAVELDLNGHTIALSGESEFLVYSGNMNVTGTGTINSEASDYAPFYVWGSKDLNASNFSTLTLGQNTTVKTGSEGWGIIVPNYDGHAYGAVMNLNGAIEAGYGITINGIVQDVAENAPTINIGDGARFTTTGHAIYAAGYGIWNIGAATITGGDGGVGVKAGRFVFSNTAVNATGAYVEPQPWGNGINASGATIQIESHDGYADHISMEFNGGTYASANGNVFLEYKEKENTVNSVQNVAINGGTFTAGSDKEVFQMSDNFTLAGFISGGTFSGAPVEEYLANGYDVFRAGEAFVVEPTIGPAVIETVFLQPSQTYTYDLGEKGKYASLRMSDASKDIASAEGMTVTATAAGEATAIIHYGGLYHSGETSYDLTVYEVEAEEVDDAESDSDREIVKEFVAGGLAEALAGDEATFNDGRIVVDVETLKATLAAGGTVESSIDVEGPVVGDEVDLSASEEGAAISEKLGQDEVVVAAYEVQLGIWAVDAGGDAVQIGLVYNMDNEIELEFEIPEEYLDPGEGKTRTFFVTRGHTDANGEVKPAEKLDAVLVGNKLKVKSKDFSTFVITYQDEIDMAAPGTGLSTKTVDFVTSGSKVGVWMLAVGMMMLGYGMILLGKEYRE